MESQILRQGQLLSAIHSFQGLSVFSELEFRIVKMQRITMLQYSINFISDNQDFQTFAKKLF